MKKQILFVLFTVLMSFSCFAQQDIVTVKDINFTLYPKSKEATVVAKDGGYTGSVNIPETITIDYEPYKVTGIASGAFANCSSLKEVIIPSSVLVIYENAFVDVPKGLNIYINKTDRFLTKRNAFDQSCFNNATLYLPTERILKNWMRYPPYNSFKNTGIVPKAKSDGVDRRSGIEKAADNPRMRTSSKSKRITY